MTIFMSSFSEIITKHDIDILHCVCLSVITRFKLLSLFCDISAYTASFRKQKWNMYMLYQPRSTSLLSQVC